MGRPPVQEFTADGMSSAAPELRPSPELRRLHRVAALAGRIVGLPDDKLYFSQESERQTFTPDMTPALLEIARGPQRYEDGVKIQEDFQIQKAEVVVQVTTAWVPPLMPNGHPEHEYIHTINHGTTKVQVRTESVVNGDPVLTSTILDFSDGHALPSHGLRQGRVSRDLWYPNGDVKSPDAIKNTVANMRRVLKKQWTKQLAEKKALEKSELDEETPRVA